MKHTTGDRPKHRTKADKLENLFHTLLLDLGSRIADNEINIKNATNFKYKYESIFLEIIENNVDLDCVSKPLTDNEIWEKMSKDKIACNTKQVEGAKWYRDNVC